MKKLSIRSFTILLIIFWIFKIFKGIEVEKTLMYIIPLLFTGLSYNFFEEKNKKTILITIATTFLITIFLKKSGYENVENIIILKKILSLSVIITFLYFIILLKKGYNFENIFIKTLIYVGYGILSVIFTFSLIYLLNYLFKIQISDKIYISMFIAIFGIIFQFYYADYKKYTSTAINYLFISFVTIGLLLVYLNTVLNLKEKLNLSLHLILWFSYLAFAINTVLNKKYINIFLIPLNTLLIYFSLKNITTYGITENRYFILIFGILLLILNILNIIFSFKVEIYAKIFVITIIISVFIPYINAFSITNKYLTDRYMILYNKDNINEKEIKELESIYVYQKSRNISLPYEYKKVELNINQENYDIKEYSNDKLEINFIGYKKIEYVYINYNLEYDKEKYSYKIKGKDYDLIDLVYNNKLENEDFKIIILNGNISKSNIEKYPYPLAYLDIIILIK